MYDELSNLRRSLGISKDSALLEIYVYMHAMYECSIIGNTAGYQQIGDACMARYHQIGDKCIGLNTYFYSMVPSNWRRMHGAVPSNWRHVHGIKHTLLQHGTIKLETHAWHGTIRLETRAWD